MNDCIYQAGVSQISLRVREGRQDLRRSPSRTNTLCSGREEYCSKQPCLHPQIFSSHLEEMQPAPYFSLLSAVCDKLATVLQALPLVALLKGFQGEGTTAQVQRSHIRKHEVASLTPLYSLALSTQLDYSDILGVFCEITWHSYNKISICFFLF